MLQKMDITVTDQFWNQLHPHYGRLKAFARSLLPEAWEDVLQEALLSALGAYDGLRDPVAFRSWIYTIVANEAHRQRRRAFWRRFHPLAPDPDPESGHPQESQAIRNSDGRDPHEAALTRLHLRAALSRLDFTTRSTLLLYYVAGFSIREIAQARDEGESAVKMRLSRARKRLCHLLEGGLPLAAIAKVDSGGLEDDYEEYLAGKQAGSLR